MVKLSVQEMLNKYSKNITHSNEVKNLSLKIFDEVSSKVHKLNESLRGYLESASLLHDIGYYIDAKAHNKHSMNLIVENGLLGYTELEVKIIACICRYHRGGLPDKVEHEIYNTLDKKERKIVKRLAGILKIADGLASGDKNFVNDIKLNFDEDNNIVEFIIYPKTQEFLPDISHAIRKRDLFEIAFKCQCVLKFAR